MNLVPRLARRRFVFGIARRVSCLYVWSSVWIRTMFGRPTALMLATAGARGNWS